MLTKRDLVRSAATAAIAAATVKSIPASAQSKAEWPSLLDAKAIAEEGFIYGLPIVMNYAVMHEFGVDKNSGQYKAPFNQIDNKPASSPPKTRQSSRRTATLRTQCSGWISAPSQW